MESGIIVNGNRGGRILVLNDFRYQKNKLSANRIIWRCGLKTCRAYLKTSRFPLDIDDEQNFHVFSIDHYNHPPQSDVINRAKFRDKVREKITQDPTKPLKRQYNLSVIEHMQGGGDREYNVDEYHTLKSMFSRTRANCLPDRPDTIEDVEIYGQWSRTWNDKRFLLELDNDWEYAVFATDRNLITLSQCKEIYIDATFRSTPAPYEQVFNILGRFHGFVIPLVTAVMGQRQIGNYRQILQVVKRRIRQLGSRWRPRLMICDFEQALISSLETEFPNAEVRGCYFHFLQNLWKHVQTLGLSIPYGTNRELKKLIRKIMSIGYLPSAIVRMNFFNLKHDPNTRRLVVLFPALRNWINYVETTYIVGNWAPRMWNVFDRNMSQRTNNNIESFHKQFNLMVEVRHPSLWVFIRKLKDMQLSTKRTTINAMNGRDPPARQRKWKLLENKLVQLKQDYLNGNRTIDSFWNAASRCIGYNGN